MEKVRMYKVQKTTYDEETRHRDFYTTYKVGSTKEEVLKESGCDTTLSVEEIDIKIDFKQLLKSLYDGGFSDSEVGVISDLVCKSFQSVE